jgi:hypothetical protein
LTFKYEEDRRGPTAINRDVLRKLDALFRESITLDPEISKATSEKPLYTWTVNFSNKIIATEQNVDYLLSLSEQELANIEQVMLDTTSAARESARVWIYIRTYPRWEVSYKSPLGAEPVLAFKEAFERIAPELQPPQTSKRPDHEHFEDQYTGYVYATPDALRRLDAQFLKSLTWNPAEGARDESERRVSWSVVFSNNRKIYKKSIDEILALQNARNEEIVTLRASSAYGTFQKLSFGLRVTGGQQGAWDIDFSGTPDELTVFVSEFGRCSTGLTARGASLRHAAAPFIAASVASVFMAALIGSWVPPDRLSSSDRVILVGAATGVLYLPFSFLLDRVWRALFPGFVCTIGDGEARENHRKGLRNWAVGIATTLALGAIGSLFIRQPAVDQRPALNPASPVAEPKSQQQSIAPKDQNEPAAEVEE